MVFHWVSAKYKFVSYMHRGQRQLLFSVRFQYKYMYILPNFSTCIYKVMSTLLDWGYHLINTTFQIKSHYWLGFWRVTINKHKLCVIMWIRKLKWFSKTLKFIQMWWVFILRNGCQLIAYLYCVSSMLVDKNLYAMNCIIHNYYLLKT